MGTFWSDGEPRQFTNDGEDWHPENLSPKKGQGNLGNAGIMRFVFTNFQADNYGTLSGDDEGNRVDN